MRSARRVDVTSSALFDWEAALVCRAHVSYSPRHRDGTTERGLRNMSATEVRRHAGSVAVLARRTAYEPALLPKSRGWPACAVLRAG